MSRWRHHVKWWRHIKKKVTRSCAGQNFGKSHRRNFQNLLWFRSYAAKSRPGGKFTPPLGSICVLIIKLNNDYELMTEQTVNGKIVNRKILTIFPIFPEKFPESFLDSFYKKNMEILQPYILVWNLQDPIFVNRVFFQQGWDQCKFEFIWKSSPCEKRFAKCEMRMEKVSVHDFRSDIGM